MRLVSLRHGFLVVMAGALSCASLMAMEPVDVNRASVAELLHVPGMTASWAGRIVRFRPYRSKLELLEQGVVSQAVYQRIRENVVAHRVVDPNAVPRKKRDRTGSDTR